MIEQIVTSMPMFVCGVLALELVFSLGKLYEVSKLWLLIWAATATVLYACHFVYFRHLTSLLPLTDIVYVVCNMAVYPEYLVYLYLLTDERKPSSKLRLTAIAYILLAVLSSGSVIALYAMMSADELQQFFTHYLYHADRSLLTGLPWLQAVAHDVCKVIFALGVLIAVIIGGRRLKRYNLMVDQLYADTEDRSLRGLTTLLVWFLVTAALSLLANALGRQCFVPDGQWGFVWLALTSVVFSVMLCGIGVMGLQRRFSVADITVETTPAEQLPARNVRLQSVAEEFVSLMDRDQLYLQPDLRLDAVVKMMNTNRTYLLQAIRQCEGVSFSEYINRQRIAYAERLKAEYPEMHAEELAQRSGFSSVSAYYMNRRRYAHHSEKK